jgi:hypothetical protein
LGDAAMNFLVRCATLGCLPVYGFRRSDGSTPRVKRLTILVKRVDAALTLVGGRLNNRLPFLPELKDRGKIGGKIGSLVR